MITLVSSWPLFASWALLSALGAVAFSLLARGRRLATIPLEWRVAFERVRRRIQEIDADFEIVEWRSDPDGGGSLVVDRNGVRSTLPMKDLRDAPPALFEVRLREILVANVAGMVLPAPVERVPARPPRTALRPIESAADPALSSDELRRLHPRTP
jgi:hypothetical protein